MRRILKLGSIVNGSCVEWMAIPFRCNSFECFLVLQRVCVYLAIDERHQQAFTVL